MMTPKERFLANEARANAWNDFIDGAQFQEAAEAALLEMLRMTQTGDAYNTTAAMHRLEGAKAFLAILTRIGVKSAPAQRLQASGLSFADGEVPGHLVPLAEREKNPS